MSYGFCPPAQLFWDSSTLFHFFVLSGVAVCSCTMLCLSIHSSMDNWVFPGFVCYTHRCCEHSCPRLCVDVCLHFSWVNTLECDTWVMWYVWINFLRNRQTVFQGGCTFPIPSSSRRESRAPHPRWPVAWSACNVRGSNGHGVLSSCAFHLQSLMTKDVKCIFICLFAICASSLVN